MEIKGKVINFLGDSITEGHGTSDNTKRFSYLIEKQYRLKKANNYGIGGTRIAVQKAKSDCPAWDDDFCMRVPQMEKDADIVVAFGGTNDYGHGDAPIGTFSDRTPDTFYGACHFMMLEMINNFPEAQLVVCTPIHRGGEDSKNMHGAILADYVKIIKEVAEYYAIPVLDLWSVSGIQPNVPVIKEKYCPDGLHPNDVGHTILAEKIAHFILSI